MTGTNPRTWRKAALWLALLAPFFYLTYGFANHWAASRSAVPSFVMAWEHEIPFVAWTIFPYWSINAFYGLSLFLCRNPVELDRHVRRLLTAQIVAVTCFVLWPLKLSFERPPVTGAAGWMFDALAQFDQPYNQAPSLHIALLVILWDLYRRLLAPWALPILHGWSVLIAVSVLTTFQHHFIDIPTGAALGLFCLWLWPLDRNITSPLIRSGFNPDSTRRRFAIAAIYAGGAVLFGLPVLVWPRELWPLAWVVLSLTLVAVNYLWSGASGFQKSALGQTTLAARWLFAPHHIGAWLNRSVWTRGTPETVAVMDGVFLGRWPSQRVRKRFRHIIDLAAEFPFSTSSPPVSALPCLDLMPLGPDQLRVAANAIETAAQAGGPVLICCALGYARSAAAVAAWLLVTGRAMNVDDAIQRIRAVRAGVVLSPQQQHNLAALQ